MFLENTKIVSTNMLERWTHYNESQSVYSVPSTCTCFFFFTPFCRSVQELQVYQEERRRQNEELELCRIENDTQELMLKQLETAISEKVHVQNGLQVHVQNGLQVHVQNGLQVHVQNGLQVIASTCTKWIASTCTKWIASTCTYTYMYCTVAQCAMLHIIHVHLIWYMYYVMLQYTCNVASRNVIHCYMFYY